MTEEFLVVKALFKVGGVYARFRSVI